MKSIDELNKRKTPIVTIDNALEKYTRDTSLFQDKVDKANETLKRIGLPNKISTALD